MKKLLAILGMVACMIGLTACGSSNNDSPLLNSEEQTLLMEGMESNVSMMMQIAGQGAQEQYADVPVIYEGLLSIQSSMGDIGSFLGTDGGTIEVGKDDIVVDINVLGSEHNAVIEIMLDSSITITSIAVNVDYSMGEIMEKAALNTLLGMGTVFCVLILISLIISCFGLIPKLQESFKKKPVEEPEEKVDTVVAQIIEKEELSDDLELVAVISAAIAAYEGSGSADGFVVRSIRKANKSNWRNA